MPAYASPAKQAQIAFYGAEVRPVPGPRVNAKLAMWEAAERGVVPASHACHPGFLVGQQSMAWEVWEQLGRRAPDWIVVPVGQGLHLLGLCHGRCRAGGFVPAGSAGRDDRRPPHRQRSKGESCSLRTCLDVCWSDDKEVNEKGA